MVSRSGSVRWGGGWLALGGLAVLGSAAHADEDAPPLRPIGGVTLSTELQLDASGEVWLGAGRYRVWAASLQVPLFYHRSDDFFGYGVHGAYRLWPQVLGGRVFLEPNVGLTSGRSNGERELGLGGGLSFGYTFRDSGHVAFSAKVGFDIAPVAARGFVGVELMVH
jgi:hypothetical protein